MSHVARNWAGNLEIAGPRGKQAVLKELGDFANEFWAAWPSRSTLAKKLKLAPATVSNYLRDLVKDGLIVPVPWCNDEGGDAGNGYYLTGCPEEFAPIDIAFKERRYGHPRGYTPAWWSGREGTGRRAQQPDEEEEMWGEGHTDMRGAPHPYEGEGHTSVRGRVTPVLPLEPPIDPTGEPPSVSAVAETCSADAVASSSANAVAFAAAPKIPKQRQQPEANDPRTGWVPYYLSKEPAEATKNLYAAISKLPKAELDALWAEFHRKRPTVSRTCREHAEDQNDREQLNLDEVGITSLALKYGVQHYEGKWPAFVVPESSRPVPTASEPPARAA